MASFAFAIQAVSPTNEHILGFASAQSMGVSLVQVWNGPTNSEKVAEFTSDGHLLLTGGVGVGNSVSATSVSGVTAVMEVFDENGSSLGHVPIYSSFS